jgi:hypothetical protein
MCYYGLGLTKKILGPTKLRALQLQATAQGSSLSDLPVLEAFYSSMPKQR